MKKVIFYIFLTICFILVTFFGLGPVFFADGEIVERLITLLVVLALYALIFIALKWFLKHNKK